MVQVRGPVGVICTACVFGKDTGVNMKAVILLGNYGLNANISFTFQTVKNLSAPSHISKFVGDFWVYLGINSFSQRISKIYKNRKF